MTDKIKTPVRYEADSQIVWTADNIHLCDIRGFGYLTGVGGLHLSPEEASAIQDGWGQQIADALNAADARVKVLETALDRIAKAPPWSSGTYSPEMKIAIEALAESKRLAEENNG